MYPSIPVDTVAKRYGKWGGVACYALHYAEDLNQEDLLRQEIEEVDF